MLRQIIAPNRTASANPENRARNQKFFAALVKRLGLALLILMSFAQVSFADSDSCDYCKPIVPVGFNGSLCSTTLFRITVNGAVKHWGYGECNGTFTPVPDVMMGLTLDQTYQLQVVGACSTHLNFFSVPDDYKLEINGKETTTIDKAGTSNTNGDGIWNITVRRKCECDNGNAGESSGPKQGSVMWDVGLGYLSDGRPAGSVGLHSAVLDANIYTPFDLVYSPPGFTSEIDVVLNPDSSLRQINAPQALADIIAIDSNQYEVRFYRHADVGAKDQNGIYAVSNQPYVVWRVSNPHLGYTDQLQISKIQNGITDSSLYTWNSVTDNWGLATGAGARTETKTKTTDPATGDKTETFTVINSLGQVVSKIARTYHQFPWSLSWNPELIRETVDPDGAALMTTYVYYENSSETARYRRLKSVSRPNGSWEQYDYDSGGNQVLILRPWKDQALASASEATSYAIRKTYSNFDGITTSLHARFVSSVIEKIAGATIRKTTYSRTGTTVNGEPAAVENQVVYSSATATLTTVTTSYHSTASAFFANRVISIQYPDGRKDSYTYEKGNYVTNSDPALNQFTPDANGQAQRQTVVHGTSAAPAGVAFKSTKDVVVRDQFGHVGLQEGYVYTGSGYSRSTWSVMDYDDRGHLTQTRRNNGTVTTAIWDGDQKTSDIDENGTETTYTYDPLNRIATSTRKGVPAAGGFPAQTDVVTTYTSDTEGRTTQETTASGGLSLIKTTSYDIAGRVKTETDAAGLVTSHTYTNGGRTETISLPGGATRITDNYFDGQTKTIFGTSVFTQFFDYGVNADGTPYTQEFIGSAGGSSPRWAKRSTDWMGRVVKVEKPSFTAGSNLIELSTYNSLGRLQAESAMVGSTRLRADKLHEYDVLGNQTGVGFDIDGSGVLALASTDRITETDFIFQQSGTDWTKVTTSKTYLTNGSSTPTTTATQSERLNNFAVNGSENTISDVTTTDAAGNQTRNTTIIDRAAKLLTTRSDSPSSTTDAVAVTHNGLLQSPGSAAPVSPSTYTYDALGRLTGFTDPATGSNTRFYDLTTGQLTSESHETQTTTYEYYAASHPSAGRLKSKTDANGKKAYFNYNSRGEVVQQWGDTTYPIEYVFDAYGQKTEMHTFRGGSGWQGTSWPTATVGIMDVTKWIYHAPTGLLTNRQDASANQVLYTYDTLGRVATRKWARVDGVGSPITTTYSYNPNSAEMSGINYSDTTQPVTFVSDRGGRISSITDAAGSHTLTYNAAAQLLTDQVTGGLLDGVSVTVGYDAQLRRGSLQSTRNAATLSSQTYGYDASSRLATVSSGSQTATYGYNPTTGLLNTTTFTGGTQIAGSYDTLGRLETIATTTPASGTVASYTYTYNNLNQRTRVTREDNAYWSYAYNDRGEVTSGTKFWSDNSPVAGQQTEYVFDSIGNRTSTKAGGDPQGLNLRQASYTANSLNQYQQRTVPGAVDILGTADPAATVTVNDQATYRRGDYFYKEWLVDNTLAPVYVPVKVFAIRTGVGGNGEDAVMQNDGHIYVPKNAEVYTYDADGNLKSDGRWNYTWDAENRLTSMQAITAASIEARKRLEFVYDYMGRRIQKKVYNWNVGTGSYQLQSTTKFVFDGWHLIAELDAGNNLTRSSVWNDNDLLLIKAGANTYQVGTDGNQNVGTLIKAGAGTVSASYDYDPFGQSVKATGEYAGQNSLRFSSQYTDVETGLSYYGYRYYNPQSGRWIGRDPIEEAGGENLYAFLKNDSVNDLDLLGQKSLSDYAHEKMWDLYKNRAKYVGRYYEYDKRGKEDIDCYSYVYQVLVYAYKKIGRPDVARELGKYSAHGTSVAKYLVSLGWTAHYWNPDVDNPHDGDKQMLRNSYYLAKRTRQSWGSVPVSGFIVNYRPTPTTQSWWQRLRGLNKQTPLNYGAFDRLNKVKFGYGIVRLDTHTFLYSYGEVFEVHWDVIDNVFERSSFYSYKWNAGLMITPPDSGFVSDP